MAFYESVRLVFFGLSCTNSFRKLVKALKTSTLKIIPLFGIAIFIGFYFYAAAIYPGGQKFDHQTVGYDHLNNYWCDLMDQPTYSGQENPGQPLAVASLAFLALSLLPFYYYIPTLFRPNRSVQLFIRYLGVIAMFLTALMPLAHDQIISVAGPLGLIAFAGSVICLFQAKHFMLASSAVLAVLCAGANFLMWKTGFHLEWMPLVQKCAFLSIFLWIGLTTRTLLRHA